MLRLALFASLLAMNAAPAEEWPQWLGPRRDGTSAETFAALKEPKPLWSVDAGEGNASPVVGGGMVFVHERVGKTEAEAVRALDAATGKEVWSKSYERGKFAAMFGNGPRATPALADGTLYTFGITGVLVAWDAKTGKELWKRDTHADYSTQPLGFGASGSPLVHGGKVVVMVGSPKPPRKGAKAEPKPAGMTAGLAAYDAKTGEPAWHTEPMPASYASPIVATVAKATQIIALTGSHLAGFDPKDGKTLWKEAFKDKLNESSTTPVVLGDGGLLCSSVTAGAMRIDLSSDEAVLKVQGVAWRKPELTCYFSTPVAIDGGKHLLMVVGKASLLSAAADLLCVEAATGKTVWSLPKVGKYHATILKGADGILLLLDDSGAARVFAPDVKEYRELGAMKLAEGKGDLWAHPAVAGGILYIRDSKSLKAYKLAP